MFVSRAFQYQRAFRLQETSDDWSEPVESQHCEPSSARDDSKWEESHRGLPEQAQNKNLDFLGKSCYSAGVEDTCRFPE